MLLKSKRKLLYRWREPDAFLAAQKKVTAPFKWWLQPAWLILVFTLYLAIWVMSSLHRNLHPFSLATALISSSLIAIAVIYGVPFALRQLPPIVSIYEGSIIRMGWTQLVPLKIFGSYAWSTTADYLVLNLITQKGGNLQFGVPDSDTRSKIDEALQKFGLAESNLHSN